MSHALALHNLWCCVGVLARSLEVTAFEMATETFPLALASQTMEVAGNMTGKDNDVGTIPAESSPGQKLENLRAGQYLGSSIDPIVSSQGSLYRMLWGHSSYSTS